MPEEVQINDPSKLSDPYDPRNKVIQNSILSCHWNLQAAVEVSEKGSFLDGLPNFNT